MRTVNILCANVFDRQDLRSTSWYCCIEHDVKVDFAVELEEIKTKVKAKKYDGVILGHQPKYGKYSGFAILTIIRQISGYEVIPAVILVNTTNQFLDEMQGMNENLMIVTYDDLGNSLKKVIHDLFLTN